MRVLYIDNKLSVQFDRNTGDLSILEQKALEGDICSPINPCPPIGVKFKIEYSKKGKKANFTKRHIPSRAKLEDAQEVVITLNKAMIPFLMQHGIYSKEKRGMLVNIVDRYSCF